MHYEDPYWRQRLETSIHKAARILHLTDVHTAGWDDAEVRRVHQEIWGRVRAIRG